MPRHIDNQRAVLEKLRGASKTYDDGDPITRALQAAPEIPIAGILQSIEAALRASGNDASAALAELAGHCRALARTVAQQQIAIGEMLKVIDVRAARSTSFVFEHERDTEGKIQRTIVKET